MVKGNNAPGDRKAGRWVVFTDLDGTLLDFETYRYDAAAPAVAALRAAQAPLVFCSSKTQSEQEVYREALQVDAPFIVENGGAIFIPAGTFAAPLPEYAVRLPYQVIELGVPAAHIRQVLARVRAEHHLQFYGYADLSLPEICHLTGLDEVAAARAAQREYSETILKSNFLPQSLSWFNQILAEYGLICVSGGKFHTVSGRGSDKGRAVALLTGLFRQQLGPLTTVGLGDSANDAPLLAAVDQPFLVQKPSGQWQAVDLPHLTRVEGVGPLGWRRVIFGLLGYER